METASKPVPTAPVEGQASQEIKAPQETAKSTDGGQEERIALLAKKEQAIRKQYKMLQEQKKQWEEQQKAVPKVEAPKPEDFKAKFLADPTSVGITYEDIQNTFLNQPSKEQQLIMQLKAEIESIKGEQKKSFSEIEASQKRAYEQAVKQVSREVSLLVDGNDAYELVRSAPENQEAVVKLIESTYREEGILLSAEEAAKQVEDYLEEQALSVAKLKKIQQKLNPSKPEEDVVAKEQPPQQKQSTLTNAMAASSSSTLTDKQRRERAILAFSGKLK